MLEKEKLKSLEDPKEFRVLPVLLVLKVFLEQRQYRSDWFHRLYWSNRFNRTTGVTWNGIWNWRYRTNRSYGSNRSYWINRSYRSNRANWINRSYRSNRKNRSNRANGINRSYRSNRFYRNNRSYRTSRNFFGHK
jgi:hypothetical protein